jgi:hypothetical protein
VNGKDYTYTETRCKWEGWLLARSAVPAQASAAEVDVEFKRLADTILQATTNVERNEALRSMAELFDAATHPPAQVPSAPGAMWDWSIQEMTKALRQYLHNDGSGAVFGYDKAITDRVLAVVVTKLERASLEQQIIEQRIAITPEYEGGFHAAIYGDSAEPVAKGFGPTPTAAIAAAHPQGQQDGGEGK